MRRRTVQMLYSGIPARTARSGLSETIASRVGGLADPPGMPATDASRKDARLTTVVRDRPSRTSRWSAPRVDVVLPVRPAEKGVQPIQPAPDSRYPLRPRPHLPLLRAYTPSLCGPLRVCEPRTPPAL